MSSDHCHDSCHNGCDHEGCNKPPKEYMGGSKNGPPGTPENPFPPAGHGPVMPPKVPVTTVNWNGPITTVYGRKPVTVTVTPTNGQIPTLGTGFRGLAGAVGTEVGKGVSGVLNAAGDVVGGKPVQSDLWLAALPERSAMWQAASACSERPQPVLSQ